MLSLLLFLLLLLLLLLLVLSNTNANLWLYANRCTLIVGRNKSNSKFSLCYFSNSRTGNCFVSLPRRYVNRFRLLLIELLFVCRFCGDRCFARLDMVLVIYLPAHLTSSSDGLCDIIGSHLTQHQHTILHTNIESTCMACRRC